MTGLFQMGMNPWSNVNHGLNGGAFSIGDW